MKLDKYKQNLMVIGDGVYSYNTRVATINQDAGVLYVHGWWSMTTSKHVNYVAKEFNLRIVKNYESTRV